jgi:EAL domain-containing protein (putative c-di-GMP-specific phosphodiesterase class I)/ActR/RegA family two-component response regulator
MSARASERVLDEIVTSSRALRIILLDDDSDALRTVVELLDSEPAFEVVGSAPLAEEGIGLMAKARPDVALVDFGMGGGEGDRATRELLESSPDTKVVAFSATPDKDAIMGMFRAGAIGFVDKGSPPQEILDSIRAVAEGHTVVSPEISGEMVVELAGRIEAEEVAERDSRSRRSRVGEALSDPKAMRMAFQPIYEISSKRVVGFEALARFLPEPHRPPNEWFEEAESVGLGTALEVEAVRRALRHMSELPEGAYLSVNVSPKTVSALGLQPLLEGVALDHLVVELTEHAVVEDYGTLGQALGDLRERGVRLAVDDAGAGYASLRHIVRLDPDIIKLDAELTRGIEDDPTRRALATALISFARETGESIIAEGVETTGQLDVLQALGVPFAQGFLLGRPAPLPAHAPVDGAVLARGVAAGELRTLARSWQGNGSLAGASRGPSRRRRGRGAR